MSDMRRREFITLVGAAAMWPFRAHAQQQPKMLRVRPSRKHCSSAAFRRSRHSGRTWRPVR
jgi:hypothetical protein